MNVLASSVIYKYIFQSAVHVLYHVLVCSLGNRTFFVVNNSPAMKLAQMYQFIAEGPHEKKQ